MTEPARFTVEFSPAALNDLVGIAQFLSERSGPDESDAFIDMINERVASLARFPLKGSQPKETGDLGAPGFRQLVHGRYRIIYAVIGGLVSILLIADGRRDMQALLRTRLLAPDAPD